MKKWTLEGKKALVTGGSKGIGLAIVEEFLGLGAEVLFTARDEEGIHQVERSLQAGSGRVHGLVADVTDASRLEFVKEWLTTEWRRLDILVNNAGINLRKNSIDYSPEALRQVIDIDLLAPFEWSRRLFPLLQQSAGASVINIASVAGSFDVQTGAPYGMSKAGVIQLGRNLANEWSVHGIRVNAVSPWFTKTPLTSGLLGDPERLERILSVTPLSRIAEPAEVAAAVAFLAMDKASYITGQNLVVDGGTSIRVF